MHSLIAVVFHDVLFVVRIIIHSRRQVDFLWLLSLPSMEFIAQAVESRWTVFVFVMAGRFEGVVGGVRWQTIAAAAATQVARRLI